MGLDAYLYIETYAESKSKLDWFKHKYIRTCIWYGRKSYRIHDWFCDNCGPIINNQWSKPLSSATIEELLRFCKQDECDGSLDYTIPTVSKILKKYPKGTFYYRANW